MAIEPKDWVALAGVTVTLALGIYNFYVGQRSARRTSIIGAVTNQRLKWGEEIQELIGAFCGAAHYLRFSVVKGSDEERKTIEEINRLRHRIPFNLCQHKDNKFERKIEQCVKKIADISYGKSSLTDEEFRYELDMLVSTTQDLLRENWIAIVDEAERGIFTPRLGGEAQLVRRIRRASDNPP